MIKDKINADLNVPSKYQESTNELCDLLLERIEKDSVSISHHTVKNRKASVKKIRPILDSLGIYKIDQLLDLEVQKELRRSIAEALDAGKLGRGGTPDTHLGNFVTLCGRVGLPDSEVKHLKGIFRQSYRDAEIEEIPKLEWTPEMVTEIIKTAHEWLNSDLIKNKGNHWSYSSLPRGYRNIHLSEKRMARVLAWAGIQIATGARSADINKIRRSDLTEDSVSWKISKGRRKRKPKTATIPPPIQPLLNPILSMNLNERDYLFNVPKGTFSEDSQTKGDLRALILASGIPQHFGRTGLHGARSAMVEACRREGVSPSKVGPALGHRDSRTAEIHYSEAGKKIDGKKAIDTYHKALEDLYAIPPEWKFEDEEIPWNKISSPMIKQDPLDLGPFLSVEHDGPDESGLKGLWRLRYVLVKEDDDGSDWWFEGWRRYGAYESSQGDVLIPWHKELGSMKYKHLWLCKGGMHKLWWACLDLNQSPFTPLEYVLPGVVKDMRQAIAEGDLDCFERLCSLLESLGGIK